jgi:hypothetical protein
VWLVRIEINSRHDLSLLILEQRGAALSLPDEGSLQTHQWFVSQRL